MKRKIILGLSVYSALFLLMGLYIIYTIQFGTVKLNDLIQLHQVEILREHFLIQIKRVQSDLSLKNTPYEKRLNTIVEDVRNVEKVIDACFGCHHAAEVQADLDKLRESTNRYKVATGRVLTYRASTSRLAEEEDVAFRAGEALTEQVGEMVALTSAKLNAKTEGALRDIARSRNVLYILIASGPLISLVLAVVFIRGFTKPVRRLLEATRSLKSGNLDHRVEGLKEEFGELASSFNEMAGSLKEQMHKMQRTEQMAVAGELAAGLAHEIKNPMAGIKVAMSVLSEEAYISPEDKSVLQKVIDEITQLEGLMKSFLNFAKPRKPRLESVDVNRMLDATLTFHLRHQAVGEGRSGKIEIVKEFGELPTTQADPTQLQQVFLNLFLNALHAMPREGKLGVRTGMCEDGKTIRIEVSDTGSGIPEDLVDKVFQPFFTTKPKGTGLGLAISRQMIEQHDGTIAAANRPGGGVLFAIRLPVKPEGAVA